MEADLVTEQPREVRSTEYHEARSLVSLDGRWGDGDYPVAMTDTLVEAFSALDGWAVPLAVALGFCPAEKLYSGSTPDIMLLANELTDDVQLQSNWRTWAEPMGVEQITGDVVRTVIHDRLSELEQEHGKPHQLEGMRFMACRFAIGPDSMPEEFILSSWGGTETRSVHTTTADGQRWISEPQETNEIFLPVNLEITGTDISGYKLEFNMNPKWSYFGDKDSPGWPTIVATAERLLAMSDRWTVRNLKPGDPDKRW